MAGKHLLEIKDLVTTFRSDGKEFNAIEGVSMHVDRGEIVGMETVKELVEEISGSPVPEIYDDGEDDEDWEDSVESLLLPPGIIAALGRAGIETIDQLTEMTEKEVLAIKGIGKKALEDIKDALDFEDRKLKE